MNWSSILISIFLTLLVFWQVYSYVVESKVWYHITQKYQKVIWSPHILGKIKSMCKQCVYQVLFCCRELLSVSHFLELWAFSWRIEFSGWAIMKLWWHMVLSGWHLGTEYLASFPYCKKLGKGLGTRQLSTTDAVHLVMLSFYYCIFRSYTDIWAARPTPTTPTTPAHQFQSTVPTG